MFVDRLTADEAAELILEPRQLYGHKEHLDEQQEDYPHENQVRRRLKAEQLREERGYFREYAYHEQDRAEEKPEQRVADREMRFSDLDQNEDERQQTDAYENETQYQ